MPDNQPSTLTTLEIAVGALKSDITVIENTIEALRATDDRIESSTSKAAEDIISLRLEMGSKFNTVASDISILQSDVKIMQENVKDVNLCAKQIQENVTDNKICLTKIDDKLDVISSGNILDFSSINTKKIGVWTTFILSIIGAIFAGIATLQGSTTPGLSNEDITNILQQQEIILEKLNSLQ